MFLQRSVTHNEVMWNQAGIRNKFNFLALIDEFIQQDELFRKIKSRTWEKNRRDEMDRKIIEARTKRIEKERREHATLLSIRIHELDRKKRDKIQEAQRRFQRMEIESQGRAQFLKKRVQHTKLEIHKKHERDRHEAVEKERHMTEAEVAKMKATLRLKQLREDRNKEENAALEKSLTEIDSQNSKVRADTEQKMDILNKKQQKMTNKFRHYFRSLERNFEQDTFSLVARINELEKEKERQKEKLRKRNEEFKKELERRKHLPALQRDNNNRWRQEYITKVKNKIANLSMKKDMAKYEYYQNHSAETKTKHPDAISRNRPKMGFYYMHSFYNEISKKKERATDKVIDGNIEKRNKKGLYSRNKSQSLLNLVDGNSNASEDAKDDDVKEKEREQQRKWDLEAKEREKQRVKEAFQKLMGNLGSRTKSCAL